MSRYRDDRDDEYYRRRAGRRSHAEDRFNEAQRENYDRSSEPRGSQFVYDDSSIRDRLRSGSNPRDYDDYGRDRYDDRRSYAHQSRY